MVHSRDVEDCGDAPRRKSTLKPAKIPYITMWQHWLAQKSFQIDPKCFQKVATEFFLKNYSTEFSTDWLLACLMPSDWCNSTMVNVWAWFFHCSTSLQPKRCLFPYRCTYNVFFMDLPWPSFVYHSSLFTMKSVDLVMASIKSSIIFIMPTLITKVLF